MALAYGQLDLCNTSESRFCVVDALPTGTGLDSVDAANPMRGERAAHLYPPDAKVFMSAKFGGLELADFVANTVSFLIVHRRVKEVFEKINQGDAEYIPLAIFNHKRRQASVDYFIVNPIGTYDVLDLKASEIEWDGDDVVSVDKMVLDPRKVKKAPDMFRPNEDPTAYIISKRIAAETRKFSPPRTNMHYVDLFEFD
jgi:hypothetical protein